MSRHTLKRAKRPAVVVGKIHAKWCSHCIALVPEWEKMTQQLKQKHPNIMVEEVEQSEEATGLNRINRLYRKRTATQVALQGGYPTIFKIVKGKLSYYNGERKADALVEWVTGGLRGGYDIEIPPTQTMAKLPSMLGGMALEQNSDKLILGKTIVGKTIVGGRKRKTQRKRSNRRRKTCRKCKNLFSFW